MQDALGDDEALLWQKLDGAALEVDQKLAVDHVKEFVLGIVLVPVEFALHDGEAHDRIVHTTKRLVAPSLLEASSDLYFGSKLMEYGAWLDIPLPF